MTTEQRTIVRIQIGETAVQRNRGSLCIVTGGKYGEDYVLLANGGALPGDQESLAFEHPNEAWQTAVSFAYDLVNEGALSDSELMPSRLVNPGLEALAAAKETPNDAAAEPNLAIYSATRAAAMEEARRLLVLGPSRPADKTRTLQDLLALIAISDGRPLPNPRPELLRDAEFFKQLRKFEC